MSEDEPEEYEDRGPSIDEIDDEMKGLLDQLDRDDDIVGKMEDMVKANHEPPQFQLDENHDVDIKRMPTADNLKPADVRNADEMLLEPPAGVEPAIEEPPIVDMRKQFAQMELVTEEILQGTRADRQECQDTINLLRGEIDKAIGGGSQPQRMYVDNLVSALEVKATVNMTAVKIMEAKAKLLAATKAGTVIQNQITNANSNVNTGVNDKMLSDLLSQPLSNEDEY